MTEYISREAVLKAIQPRYAPAINKVLDGIIKSVPAADVVPVVRCEKCMYCHEAHYENPGEPPYIKRRCTNKYAMANSGYAVLEDGFCSYGERGDKNTADDGDVIVADAHHVMRGRWITRRGKLYCSACGKRACVTRDIDDFWYIVGTKYCPECGAKMDTN